MERATGETRFTYLTVVTRLLNADKRHAWEQNREFTAALAGNPIRILTLAEMMDSLWADLTTAPAASEIGRALQLMKAAGWETPKRPGMPGTRRRAACTLVAAP